MLATGGALAALLMSEAAVRILGVGAIPSPRRVVIDGHSREWCCGPEVMAGNVHRFIPGSSFKHCYDGGAVSDLDADGCVTYRINSQGYRGAEFGTPKPAGAYRIVILGDSFTFGEGTPEQLTYPRVLQDAWRSRPIDGRRVEVINLGVPNEDSGTELTTYRDFARGLSPDWLIVQWNTNDVPISAVQKDHVRLIGRQYRDLYADADRYKWSRLLVILYERWRAAAISNELMTTTRADAEGARASLEDLGRIAELARADGSRFTVLAFPELIRFDAYPYAAILTLLEEFCRARTIELVNLLPALSTHRDRDLWVHPTDHHPNRVAHALAARELNLVVSPSGRK